LALGDRSPAFSTRRYGKRENRGSIACHENRGARSIGRSHARRRTGDDSRIAGVKAEIAAVRAEFKADIELRWRDLTIRLGSMMLVAVGILLAGIRYLPPPH